MTNNTFYILRHAATRVDKNTSVSKWHLSEEGKVQAKKLALSCVFDDVDIVISSGEEKAYQTAKPIADKLGKDVIGFEGLNELNRDAGGFLEKDEFDRTINFAMSHLNEYRHKWEAAQHALERFSQTIERIDFEYDEKNILLVAHGCVINLYFAKLADELDKINDRWKKTDFCSWGIIKNGKVLKDIVE